MIYAVGGGAFIKFGKAGNVGRRLEALQCACPDDLEILAVAAWPDEQERAVHAYLAKHRHRGEWFRKCAATERMVSWMRDAELGLRLFTEHGRRIERKAWHKADEIAATAQVIQISHLKTGIG